MRTSFYADATSTVAKGVDAAIFDGSNQDFLNQAGKTAISYAGARFSPSLVSSYKA